MGLAVKGLLADTVRSIEVQVHAGLSAAKSIASRPGTGKVRRAVFRELLVQDRVAKGELIAKKAQRRVADVLTERIDRKSLATRVMTGGVAWISGRCELLPQLGST